MAAPDMTNLNTVLTAIEGDKIIVYTLPPIFPGRHTPAPMFYHCKKGDVRAAGDVITLHISPNEAIELPSGDSIHFTSAQPLKPEQIEIAKQAFEDGLVSLCAFAEEQESCGVLHGYDPMEDELPVLSKDDAAAIVDWSTVTGLKIGTDTIHLYTTSGLLAFSSNIDWYNVLS